jgi:hypothetical protein
MVIILQKSMSQFEYKTLVFKSGIILVRKFHGPIEVPEIISSWKYLLENKMLGDEHIGVINDLCDCKLIMDEDCFRELIGYLKNNPVFQKLKLAVICDTPEKIVFPSIGEHSVKELHIKPFSTLDAAIDWILVL